MTLVAILVKLTMNSLVRILAFLLALSCGSTTLSPIATASTHVNVLHIIIDDLRPALGCYGDPIAQTPSIDKLAKKGMRFDRAYVQYPICGPSRASFLSGLRPQTTNYFGWAYPPGAILLPTWLRQNGYFTAEFGKVFHHGHVLYTPEDRIRTLNPPGAWDVSDLCATDDDPCGYGYLYSEALRPEDPRASMHVVKRGSLCPNGLKGGWFWQEWAETDLSDEMTSDGVVVRKAAKAIEWSVHEGKPFYVVAGIRRPHQVLAAPKRYFDMYPLDSIPSPPKELRNHLDSVPSLALNFDKSLAYNIYSTTDRRQLWRAYYANISFVDAQVAVLLDILDKLDLWKNTVVVFHSDHGWHLGEHGGLGNKDTLYEESTRTPLIIVAPGYGNGTARSSSCPVELVDIFPTLASLCHLRAPKGLDGLSLQCLLQNPQPTDFRPGAISVVRRYVGGREGKGFSGSTIKLSSDAGPEREVLGRSVRTELWRYSEWDGGKLGVELYDMTNDPRELNNLANLSEFAAVQLSMSHLLRQLDPTITKNTK